MRTFILPGPSTSRARVQRTSRTPSRRPCKSVTQWVKKEHTEKHDTLEVSGCGCGISSVVLMRLCCEVHCVSFEKRVTPRE